MGKNANILELCNHTDVEETSTEFCLIVKTNWRCLAHWVTMYQIARPERDIFAQLFLELSDIISSHHYDALIHKSFISWWLRFLKFHILARFLFFSLIDGRAGPPRILTRAPPPSSLSCLTNLFWKIFLWNRGEAPPPALLVRSPKASLASDPNGGSSPMTTQARQPVLLVEMIPKVEKRGFCSVEKHDQRFFP